MNLLSARVPNQLVENGNFVDGSTNWSTTGCASYSFANNEASFLPNARYGQIRTDVNITAINGHKYYYRVIVNSTTNSNRICFSNPFNNILSFGATNGYEVKTDIVTYADTTATNRIAIQSDLTSGWNTIYVKSVNLIDLTELYGQGLEPTLEQFKQDYPLDYYPYSATSYTGLLQQNGKAVTADISSMLPSGIGCVDLGSLNWNIAGDVFESVGGLTDAYPLRGMGMVCSRYLSSEVKASVQQENKTIQILANGYLWIRDTDYTTTSELKQSLDGVLLFYRKSTS